MRCPYCHTRDSRVTDSRANDDGIRRRRQCISCGERFTTTEIVQLATFQVVKKDGRREDFLREKLLGGLRKACSKREVSVAQIELVVAEIEAKVTAEGRAEVPAAYIGELAMDALRHLDHIAYIRFASVYRPFTDIESLKEAVLALETVHAPEDRTVQLTLPTASGDERARPRIVKDLSARELDAAGGRR